LQRVLIADDEMIIADTLALILKAIGFESRVAYSGEAAVEVAAQFQPDIVITDVIMNGMNGVEAAILISSMLPECKIILFFRSGSHRGPCRPGKLRRSHI
jgi:CheY-like chemotaxis protein